MEQSPKLISKFESQINPDCIKVCPFDPRIFILGHYHQIQGENIQGAISILNVSILPHKLITFPTASILHVCWINKLVNNKMFFVGACRNSTIKIFQYNQSSIIQSKNINITNDKSYCLYVDCIITQDSINIVVSTNQSQTLIYILDLDFNIKESYEFNDHEYAVWCCRINPFNPSTFLSGDEISNLIMYDIRSNPQKISKNSKIHQNGISQITFTSKQHELITGTFDGKLRWFDIRNIHKPVKQYSAEGVLWRIIPEPENKQFLLCRSSVNIFQIYNIQTQHTIDIKQHKSLAYAADWNQNFIVTASFYDKIVCVWQK